MRRVEQMLPAQLDLRGLLLKAVSDKYRALTALFVIGGIATMVTPAFASGRNLSFIVVQSSVIGVMALGSTLVILAGSIDLSPSAVATLAAIIAVSNLGRGGAGEFVAAIALALVVAFSLGILNGLLVVVGKIPSIIATLGTMLAIGGFSFFATKGAGLTVTSLPYAAISNGTFLGLSNMIWLLVILTIVLQFFLTFTKVGRHLFALGSNELAAIYSGIRNSTMKILVFGVAALLAGISGIMLTSQVSSVYPGLMTGYEINAIAAVVVGGTKLMGSAGEGSGWQTLVGAIVLAVIANALIVTGVSGYLQQFVTGLIIILATLRTSRERIIK